MSINSACGLKQRYYSCWRTQPHLQVFWHMEFDNFFTFK